MPILNKKRNYWSELIGRSKDFSLESRIFHSLSICLIALASLYIPYNIYSGLYVAAFSAFLFSIFFIYQYYRSRYLGKPHSNFAFGIIGIVIFGTNYFFNSGIDGSTDLIWPAYLLLVLAISPYKQHAKWLGLYLICFLAIHFIEYQFPFLIRHPFYPGRDQFLDRITISPMPVIVIYIVINFIKRSYDKEKKLTEEKTLIVAENNKYISLQNDQLEQSNSEKNKLMSIISHDLRSPLISIQNYLELLNEYELGTVEREHLEKTLLTSTNNAIEMLSNLLSWSKSQMDGVNVNLVKVSLLEALSNTLAMEKMHALKKEISLSYQIPENITVIADVDMLQLVVRNLVSNAIKFTQKGGEIHIEAELVQSECKITVRDNGKGIAKEKQEKIFSISSKAEYGTNNEKGVGLGLVLCKEFTELQGGTISFASIPEQGSSFFVFIPAMKVMDNASSEIGS